MNWSHLEWVSDWFPLQFLSNSAFVLIFPGKYFDKKRLNETSSTFMKFPNDIRQAEILSGGDPNITESPKFRPQARQTQSKYE